jgi:hypothetical protein
MELEIDVTGEIEMKVSEYAEELFAETEWDALNTYIATWQPGFHDGDETRYTKIFNAKWRVDFPQVKAGRFSMMQIDFDKNKLTLASVKFDTPTTLFSIFKDIFGA